MNARIKVKETGSEAYSLAKADVHKVAVGAVIAIAPALTVYLTTYLASADLSTPTNLGLAVAGSVLLNLLRKYVTNTKAPCP